MNEIKHQIPMQFIIDPYDLIDKVMFNLSCDEIFEFIKLLEFQVGEYGLSEKLYEHFSKIHEEYLQEGSD